MADWKPPSRGALDDTPWPDKLVARAIAPGDADDRMHGYAVLGDIARHYRYSDLVYLAITGELPSERASALFHVALCSFATMSVGEAPVHVGVVARITGGAALGAGLVVLADHARYLVDAHASLVACLRDGSALPAEHASAGDADYVRNLRDAAASQLVRPEMTRDAARIALLYEAGVREPDRMEAAIVSSRMLSVAAETLATGSSALGSYPILLPPFHYVEDD